MSYDKPEDRAVSNEPRVADKLELFGIIYSELAISPPEPANSVVLANLLADKILSHYTLRSKVSQAQGSVPDDVFFDRDVVEQRRILGELFAKWDLLKDTVNELVVAANPSGGPL